MDLNPVRAGLIERAIDYRWSSAGAHVSERDSGGLLDIAGWAEICPRNDWAPHLEAATQQEALLARIREATRSSKPVGDALFVHELGRKAGFELELRPPGRPPKRLALNAASA